MKRTDTWESLCQGINRQVHTWGFPSLLQIKKICSRDDKPGPAFQWAGSPGEPRVCFVSDSRFTFLAFRKEASSGSHLRAEHSSKTRCFSLQDYRRWINNEMELHQSKITFSYCKVILKVQTLWYDWWENQQTGGPILSSSDLDTSPSSACFPYFPPKCFPDWPWALTMCHGHFEPGNPISAAVFHVSWTLRDVREGNILHDVK